MPSLHSMCHAQSILGARITCPAAAESGHTVCQDYCIGPEYKCCSGSHYFFPCKGQQCCGDDCCYADQQCCGDYCCDAGQRCCGSGCCSPSPPPPPRPPPPRQLKIRVDARGAHGLLTGTVEPADKGCGVTLQVAGNADVWLAIKITPDASSILKGRSPIYWMLSPGGHFKWRSTGACFTKPDQLVTVTYNALTPLPGAPAGLDPALFTAIEVAWSWLGALSGAKYISLLTVFANPTGTPADLQRVQEFGERMGSLASMRTLQARIK